MAAAPSGASSTSYPARSKAFRSIARSSFLSSTRRRGSISLVSTMNPAVVRELRERRVQRREVAQLHDPAEAAACLLHLETGSISAPGFLNGRIILKAYNGQLQPHLRYRAHPGSPP